MKVAIIHDWLTGMRGGERVLELFCKIFPDAHIFTLFYNKGSVSSTIEKHPIATSRLQSMPFSKKKYRYLLPLFPGAIESFDLSGFDLIISTSHAVAKGAIAPKGSLSICYCHTPMRYIWDQYDAYFNAHYTSKLVRAIMPFFKDYLRSWDTSTQHRVDYYIANSRFVTARIKKFYNRDSTVIPAPVNCDFYKPCDSDHENYYLMVSALAPYKRVDLAVNAFNINGRKLIIIGSGTESNALKQQANQNISFSGKLDDEEVRSHYQRCKAVIFPGVEDFGLVPLEAQACGRPVIAYAEGGALETIVEGLSGHFFYKQSPDSLNTAIEAFEAMTFSPAVIRQRAFEFDSMEIENRLRRYLNDIFRNNNVPLLELNEERIRC
ncbi:glycosyltransferase [bacterium]|nr:glycosyltransferase [bacterium]